MRRSNRLIKIAFFLIGNCTFPVYFPESFIIVVHVHCIEFNFLRNLVFPGSFFNGISGILGILGMEKGRKLIRLSFKSISECFSNFRHLKKTLCPDQKAAIDIVRVVSWHLKIPRGAKSQLFPYENSHICFSTGGHQDSKFTRSFIIFNFAEIVVLSIFTL